MKLTYPTDFEILEVLSDGRRNNAVNIAHKIDKNRPYINTRLPLLADYGLVISVGPAPNSGLYKITEKGHVVLELKDQYHNSSNFDELVEQEMASRR